MALIVERKNRILYLTFDTPGCAVNILDNLTASQVEQAMLSVQNDSVDAVVFQSFKPGSFINGVGLLLASAVQVADDALKLTTQIRRAYQSVKDAKVPTFAAIQGNCYGCGIEFVLNCDYRIVSDTVDSHFYMTEISDYLFIPAFGGTQNLPLLVGVKKAIDLLIWGEKWTPKTAKRFGLVDEVFEHHQFLEQVESFVNRTIRNKISSKLQRKSRSTLSQIEIKKLTRSAEKKIFALPPAYHEVYHDCFELMIHAANKTKIEEKDYAQELSYAGKSVMNPISKSALSFFFIRQSVQGICLRGEQNEAKDWTLVFLRENTGLTEFKKDLESRKMRGSVVQTSSLDSISKAIFKTTPFIFIKPLFRTKIKNTISVILGRFETLNGQNKYPVSIYSPFYPNDPQIIELALIRESNEWIRALCRYLIKAGFQVVLSKPKKEFGINRILLAYLRPLIAYCSEGGNVDNVDFTLREFGFCRRIAGLLKGLDDDKKNVFKLKNKKSDSQLRRLRKSNFKKGRFDIKILDAVTISLLNEAGLCLNDGTFSHPMLIDLVAREVLDFPLRHGSLCKYLSKNRIQESLDRANEFASLLKMGEIDSAQNFVHFGKAFYL